MIYRMYRQIYVSRLFSAVGEGLQAGRAMDRVSGEPVTWTPGTDVSGLAAQVAQSVYGSLGK
jgi:hypothetical protein